MASSIKIQFVERLSSSRGDILIVASRLVSDWLPEFDLAAGMDEMDHSGFAFDKHIMEFGTLDRKIAKGILKILPADSKRKINLLLRGQAVLQSATTAHWQANFLRDRRSQLKGMYSLILRCSMRR